MKKVLVLVSMLFIATWICAAREIVVNTTADSGTGTLRWALQTAQSGDVITFDPAVFPPDAPGTIHVHSGLPALQCGDLMIDASNAGVILDGSGILHRFADGVFIGSNGNTIRGLQILGFPANGITLDEGAQHNRIGGDREIGSGPIGQGNVLSMNGERGIGLFGSGTSFNTVSGNNIGTGPQGNEEWGNTWEGVHIVGGAWNVIGPDNIISNNGTSGVDLAPGANTNTVTRNAIFDNGGPGIATERLLKPPSGIPAPSILEFSLLQGTVFGRACPGCTVEIFSDAGDEGGAYEGCVTANLTGLFSFAKEGPLRGPHITATATDAEGGSSPFSMATEGAGRVLSLQTGNLSPMILQVRKPSVSVSDNRMGVDVGGWDWEGGRDNSGIYEALLHSICERGVTWVRLGDSYCPLNWQQVLRAPGVYEIPADCDAFITELAAMNTEMVVVLGVGAGLGGPQYPAFHVPNAGHGVLGDVEPEWWFESKQQRDEFCEYARFMAQHFKGRVSYYEIWNEVESGENPGDPRGGVRLSDYVFLLEQVSSAIHTVDLDAKVVAGAVGRLYAEDVSWLEELLSSEAAPKIDAVSWHPFYGESPLLYSGEFDYHPDPFYWREYPFRAREFVGKATSLGFQGEFLVEEMTWRTPIDSNPYEPSLYTDMIAAKYLTRAFLLHFGLGCFSMVSTQKPFPDYLMDFPQSDVLRHLSPLMAGHEAIDMPVEIDIGYEPVAYCGFRYANGDRLLAIWTDGIAQDEDPGVRATIVFPGLTAGTVAGIEVLYGFEQDLLFETVGGSTVICDLLVKDYPLLIRLSDVTMSPDYVEYDGDGFHRVGEPGASTASDRDGDGVSDEEDFCPDWPGSAETNGC